MHENNQKQRTIKCHGLMKCVVDYAQCFSATLRRCHYFTYLQMRTHLFYCIYKRILDLSWWWIRWNTRKQRTIQSPGLMKYVVHFWRLEPSFAMLRNHQFWLCCSWEPMFFIAQCDKYWMSLVVECTGTTKNRGQSCATGLWNEWFIRFQVSFFRVGISVLSYNIWNQFHFFLKNGTCYQQKIILIEVQLKNGNDIPI